MTAKPAKDDAPNPNDAAPATPAKTDAASIITHIRSLGPVVAILVLIALTIPAVVGFIVLGGSVLEPDAIESALDSLGVGAPFAAAAFFALLTGAALAPTYAFSFASGAIFHSFPLAAAIAMFGVTAGSILGYLIATLLARRPVMRTIENNERARIVRAALLDRGLLAETFVITLIRIPPNSPFALTNFTLAATRANPIAYVLGTAIGIAPRTLFAVWIGVQAGSLTDSTKPRALIIGGIVVAVVVFLILYRLFTSWAREALRRQLDQNAPSDPD